VKTKPVLIVIAGPNGSGKTTITEQLQQHAWMNGCRYINPDQIAQETFGDWNSPKATQAAMTEAVKMRDDCLAHRESLALETVFSGPDKIAFIRAA
jgi:predicted ABC-type ATPase